MKSVRNSGWTRRMPMAASEDEEAEDEEPLSPSGDAETWLKETSLTYEDE